jgi:4-amino-4-deoxy-L-arabinose transferase-like glycosyltransferase
VTPNEPAPEPSGSWPRARPWLAAVLLAMGLGIAFQGSRGIWDPSEGFYTNAALGMARSGDWWVPRVNGEPFLDKPPVVYWSMAAGIDLLGANEWGARLGLVFWYAGTALLVGALARSFWGRPYGPLAASVYALSLLPFLAANTATTDPALAFWTTAATYCFWRLDAAERPRRRDAWAVALGAAVGLGLLTKGPAVLVFLPPLAVFLVARRRLGRALRTPGLWLGGLVAAAVGGSWYASMAATIPGALEYVLDNQVSGRLVSAKYGRNPGLVGALVVYLPAVLLGSLPWSLAWPRWMARAAGQWRRWDWWRGLAERPAALLIGLWFALPLLVLATASSKLPLYALPLCAPLALASARMLGRGRSTVALTPRGPRLAALGLWVLGLLALKVAAIEWPTIHDTRATARSLAAHGIDGATPLIVVDRVKNGLVLYGYGDLVQASTGENEIYFAPIPGLGETIADLDPGRRYVFISGDNGLAAASSLLAEGWDCERLTSSVPGEAFLACGAARAAS